MIQSESDYEEDAKQPSKKKKKRNADGEMLTKSGAVDKRTTKETKEKIKEIYTSEDSVLKLTHDTKTLEAGGCAQFGVHHAIFGGKYGEQMQFLDKENPHYVMDGGEKVQEGFVLLESPQIASMS